NFNCDVFLFHFTTYLLYNQRLQVPACKHSRFYLLKTHSSTVKSESKSAVTRLLPDQYLSNSVIVFTTNLSFIQICKHARFYLLKTHSSTVKSESKSAVTRLLPDQYLSNSVIVFTTNLSFI